MCSLTASFIVQLHCKQHYRCRVCVCVCLRVRTHTYVHTYIYSPLGGVFAPLYSRCSAGMKCKELLDTFLTTSCTSNTERMLVTLRMQYVMELRKILYWLVGLWWFM